MLAAKEATGERVVKKRKERSDKGKTRAGAKSGKKAATGKSSNTGKGRGRRVGDKQGGVAHGNEDDDDDDDDDEEEDQQPPKKKQKSATAAKAHAEKKLPPAPKSTQFIVDSDYDNDE